MDPTIWGNHAWFFFHTVTFAYPNKPSVIDKKNMRNFFNNIGKILPCGTCRQHYAKHLRKLPLTERDLSSRRRLIVWLFKLHNLVNPKQIRYSRFIQRYEKIYQTKL